MGSTKNSFPITEPTLRWLEVILLERFGHAWHLSRIDAGLRLQLAGAEGAILFDTLCEGFTQAHSDQPFTRWDAEREGWSSVLGGPLPAPGVAELPSPLIEQRGGEHVIHYDLLGLTYWMLARVEEIGREDLDAHGRFPATASHAVRHGYLERPVVDEWLEVLGQVIERQWPGWRRQRREPRTLVSCDVDSPFAYPGRWAALPRRMAGDLLKRGSVGLAWNSLRGQVEAAVGGGVSRRDPHYLGTHTILEATEAVGRKAAFYLIAENTDARYDKAPDLGEARMRRLLREIHGRGHGIGIHPSYRTYRYPEAFHRAVGRLREVLAEEGIESEAMGGRQHFLRWETPTTAGLWEAAGLDYDSTLSFADAPGFRCGTCWEYGFFDAVEQRALRLRERPLVVMECSVIAERYLGLGYSDAALDKMRMLRDRCHAVAGDFTLLWHNSHFATEKDREFFRELVK